MAIKNTNGNYLKVITCTDSSVIGQLFASQDVRNEVGEFDLVRPVNLTAPINLNVQADGEKTVMQNVITAGYTALKSLDEYKDWTDC